MEDAFTYALQLLARREMSAHRLEARVRQRFGEAPADLRDRLIRAGYLDDRRFARMRVAAGKHKGRARLAAELAGHGVAAEVIDEVLAAETWPSLAEAAAATMKKLRLEPPLAPAPAARLARTLGRLGYEADAIARELEKYDQQ